MNISSVLGLHGWLHVIMFAVIAVLIKRCAEMQQLPTMMRGGHEETGTETVETGTLPGMQPGTDEGLDTGLPKGPDTGMDTQERGFPTGRQTSEKSNGDLINSIGADTNLNAIGDAHGDTLRDAQGNFHGDSDTNGFTNGDSDGETASWDSYTASAYSSQNEWSTGSFSDLGTRSTVYSGRDEFTEYTGSAVYGGGETSSSLTSSSLTAKNEGTRSLQEDWERTTYCATESRNAGQASNRDSARDVSRDVARDSTIGGSHHTSSQAIYTESHLDLEDDITMLTSDATAMGEDTGNDLELDSDLGGLDLLSKASTFIIDSTVGTFMQMTQAYMQDDYSAPRKEEPPDNHAIDKEGSSVWCWGTHHSQRLCRFRNLCYLPEHDDFVFFHSPNSVISGLPHDRFSPTLLDISSVHDHNGQYFNYVDLPASQAAGLDIEMIPTTSLIYRRFNPDNLMHVIHDDLLPMYFTLHMISRNGTGGESLPFDVNLVLIENWTPGDYVNLYQVFSPYKLMFRTELEAKTKLTCFADVYVGVTKSTTWYQYGFREPQGPIPGYSVTAHEIRMFTNYLKDRLETHSITVPNGQDYVVLLTRKHNRLILNEVELTLALVTQLRVKVITLGVETHSIAEMVAILSKATVLIGMHGSLLSLAMFLRPGAILVELFPYAVNPEHYTPYKTLTKLPGMNIMYKSWRNMDSAKTVAHPDRGWDTGGINHLPKEEQDHILQSSEVPRHLCCRDAEWLYRIYQDTIVDTDALVKLVAGAMEEQSQNLQNGQKTAPVARHHRLHPGSVSEIKCTDPKEQVPSSLQSMTPPSINLSWQPPWNAQYLNPLSVKYEVWIQEQNQDQYTAWILSRTTYSFSSGLKPQTNYSVWVRCILNDMVHGPFNKDHVSCST